ncbi:hypothetical protein ACLGGT_21540 [Roseovarius sp. MS2]|uniref:hypothetical protein n=1 Tax=Roseovarius sp. MS2 TaxID=3390728 RepID=UPI003EDBF006
MGWRICLAAVQRPPIWPHEGPPLDPRRIESLLTWIILGVIVAAASALFCFISPVIS